MKNTSTLAKFLQITCDILGFIFEKVVTLLSAVMLLASTPLLALAAIPVLLYRHALNKLGRRINPSLGAMVTARGSIFALDAIYNRKKPLVSMVIQGRLDERFELSRLRKIVEERILPAKDENNSRNLKFPEFQQFITIFGGFFFWQWDPLFNLDNHIKYHRIESPLDSREKDAALNKFHEKLVRMPWQKNKPLWEFWVVDVDEVVQQQEKTTNSDHEISHKPPNVKTTTTLFMRTTHCLADGYSMLHIFTEYFSESGISLENAKPIPAHRPVWRKALFFFTFPFRAALESCSILAARLNPFTSLPFQVPFRSWSAAPMHFTTTKALSVSKMKEIKDHFNVSFTSVVHSTLTGGLRELMMSNSKGQVSNFKIPATFPLLVPLPLPSHPGAGLRNYFGGVIARLPTREGDLVRRLKMCDSDITRLKRSTFPLLSFIGIKLAGCGPAWMLRIFCQNWFTSAWLTNFPGGRTQLDIGGVEVKDLRVGLGLYTGPTGLGFVAVSSRDDLVISVTGDGTLFTEGDMKLLTDALEKQVDLLHERINVGNCVV